MIKQYISDLRTEFTGYNPSRFTKDLMAGVTVAAVALPLALAFGVSSGADAAAGLITAILAGLVIGALSGASFQISGPTGAMTAILGSIILQHGLQGVFLAGLMSGALLLLAGLLRFGKIVSIIPMPVITGFTSGIAVIIALGQIDNLFGVKSVGESALAKIASYFQNGFTPHWEPLVLGGIVLAIMILWPKKWGAILPSSLAGLIVVVILNLFLKLDVAVVGQIPQTLLPDTRLSLTGISLGNMADLIVPAFSIAALGMIESLLCGTSAGRMKGETLNADRELVAQGIGNMLIPFFGGVPATAAIARTSVAIKAGLQTRLTGIVHAVVLLLSMFLLAPVMSQIPLAALAAVLIMTAIRMNEWESIRYIFGRRFKGAMMKFLLTLIATVALNLTIAIIVGLAFSAFVFIKNMAEVEVNISEVDPDKLDEKGIPAHESHEKTRVIYLTGPIFFVTINKLNNQLMAMEDADTLIFSMRGVSAVDTSGVQAILRFCEESVKQGRIIYFCGLQNKVMSMFQRGGITEILDESHFFWSAEQALNQAGQIQIQNDAAQETVKTL